MPENCPFYFFLLDASDHNHVIFIVNCLLKDFFSHQWFLLSFHPNIPNSIEVLGVSKLTGDLVVDNESLSLYLEQSTKTSFWTLIKTWFVLSFSFMMILLLAFHVIPTNHWLKDPTQSSRVIYYHQKYYLSIWSSTSCSEWDVVHCLEKSICGTSVRLL